MAIREILQLGNKGLYETSREVSFDEIDYVRGVIQDLHDTMMEFRRQYGVGRAIAAPQIGEKIRVLYMNIGEPVPFINPRLVFEEDDMMEVWDDCMCFPNLLVKVMRYKKCRIDYRDVHWNEQSMTLIGDLSELLQHEYDHLDGILAVSRAIDGQSFAFRGEIK
ncbi:MAG: peptide deformylase [Anaerosolibacter sp.]|jgi:peptide deformylase|uniref:peptide deformylase n=1 Tax=Anaerosolibacter sp. TaxID=1872527 RepID=UPI00262B7511|nr:peptide deformylase [Anaerosolibacter sp.]MDF2546025.1 peptide deformylase [Anaerosolibacter sp.]